MTGKELRKLVNEGINPIVEFNESIEELEIRWNKGMRGYVIGVSTPDNSECVTIRVVEKEFELYNKTIEIPYWRKDYNGEFIYKWSEVHTPHENSSDYEFYEGEDEELYNIKLLDSNKLDLFKQYYSELNNNSITYIEWLENKILNK